MNLAEALDQLTSGSQKERLDAARLLSKVARSEDLPALRAALRIEKVPWIRSAIETGIARASVPKAAEQVEPISQPESEAEYAADIYARAIEELTDRFVHEVRPLLGLARLYASTEIEHYSKSKTATVLSQIQDLLKAIDTLGRVAGMPTVAEVDLARVVREITTLCHAEIIELRLPAKEPLLDGPTPLMVSTDKELVGIALRNGVRNALEASIATDEPIVVSWGGSDQGFWVAVLDFGEGPPVDLPEVFTVGTSSKEDHLGMGLAIAQQAMATVGGSALLNAQPDGTTRFEISAPEPETTE